jgi:hypothetical protein
MKFTSTYALISVLAALFAVPAAAKSAWVVKGSLNGQAFVFYQQDGKYMTSKSVCEKARKDIVAFARAQGNKTKLSCVLSSTPGKL